MTIVRCLTCQTDVDSEAPGFLNHLHHEIDTPSPAPPPAVDRKKIEEHLKMVKRYIETMSKANGGIVDGRDTMLADLLEFVLKLDKDIEALCMARAQ